MKALRYVLALMLVVLFVSGCSRRNNNVSNPDVSEPDVQVPEIVDDIEDGAEDLVSDAERGARDVVDGVEEGARDVVDGVKDGANDIADGSDRPDGQYSVPDEDLSNPHATTTMSTDFGEIGALSAEKLGWGSGGPVDSTGRPNGATAYQEKYGKYDAFFIAPSNQNIYLTFDEGYENGFTPIILDTLKEKEVSAVFFITLDFATREPKLVQRMIDEGHVLGNHSCKHLSFPDMPLREAADDIMQLHAYVSENFNYEMTLFRPPMGEFSEQSLALTQSLGYKSVFWSFAYKDYDVDNQPLTIEALDKITQKSHPGGLYLLHAVSKTNAEVLGESIDLLREQGYVLRKWDL